MRLDGESLVELISARARATPDLLFAVDENDRRLSFAEYWTRVERTAAGLPLDKKNVAVILPTRIETLVILGALARLGAVQNLILPAYRERELSFVFSQTKPDLIIAPNRYRGVDYEKLLASAAPTTDRLILADGELPDGEVEKLPKCQPSHEVRWLFYTSGTTSDPKGVRHGDAPLLASARGLCHSLDLKETDRHALVFPVTHVGGCLFLMANLMGGSAQIVIEQFDAVRSVEVLAKYDVTHAGAGTVFHQAYLAAQRKNGRNKIFPSLRALPGGGAPKGAQLCMDVERELGAPIVSGYGLTECPAVTMNRLGDSAEKLMHTEGRPNPIGKAEIKIVDGEIRVRGPQLFFGYVDETLNRDAFDADGFFRTGDLGALDEAGYLTITGRLKDVIIRKGENISAKEVEDLLLSHPNVKDVAVIGLPDEKLGERCCAVVVGALEFSEMISFLLERKLMKQKIPEQLEILESLPRNASGKVEKRLLRQRFSGTAAPSVRGT